MTDRAAMLEGIRSSLQSSSPYELLYHHLQPSAPIPRATNAAGPPEELAEKFSQELSAVGGEVRRVDGREEALATVRTTLGELEARCVAISDLELVKGGNFADVQLIADPTRDELFSVDAGVTAAQLAIAETGTLVLRSSVERHRLVSLVPPIHICLLNAQNIRPTMLSVLEEVSNEIDPAITFVTGPSRTSDIELTLAIGVHGPERLIVVLIG